MAHEIVNVEPPPQPLTAHIEALQVGETLRADTPHIQSLRTLAARVAKRSGGERVFQSWEHDGKFYVRRMV